MVKFVKNAFWNDNDGYSAKDFLMVLFGGLFALFLLVIFFAPFFGVAVSPVSIEMIGSLSPVVMTIRGRGIRSTDSEGVQNYHGRSW